MSKTLLMAFIAATLTGCGSYLKLIDGLNERQVQSCLEYNGATSLSTSPFANASGALRGVTATGGAKLELCKELLGNS